VRKKRWIYGAIGALFFTLATAIVFLLVNWQFVIDPISALVGFTIGYLAAIAEEESEGI
jgi:hypothetical protein